MSYTITNGKSESVNAGNYHNAVFVGIEKFTSGKGDELLRWKFDIDGRQASAVTGASNPTTKNRFGKFLCGLANKPLVEGTTVEPNDFIGKKYFAVVIANERGSQVEMFTLLA